MGGERAHVNTFGREKLARIFGTVDARRLDFDLLKASGGKLGAIVVFFECAGHAADPQEHALADLGRDLAPGDDVRHRKAAAGLEHTKGLPQHAVLIGREIDHAVRDDDVYGIVRKWDIFDLTFQE